MLLSAIAATFAVGIVAGLLSGLVGVGGGVLMVPFLYFFYDRPEWFGYFVAPELRVVVAHATSLFVIVPTSIRGALAYHRAGLVEWRVVWPIGLSSVLAAAGAAWIAPSIPPQWLKVGFGVFLVLSGLRLAKRKAPPEPGSPDKPLRLSLAVTVPTGIAVGTLSALLGVGGGIVSIPLLMHVIGLEIKRVAATSMGIIIITATAGTLTYMLTGGGQPGLAAGSIGYVHVAAAVAMFLGAVLSVGWGARINQRLQPRALTVVFATVFVIIGARLVLTNLGGLALTGG
jgi:uncharacterized protein